MSIANELRRSGEYEHLSQHTFTAVLPADELDESEYARAVIDACEGLESHRTEPTPERFIDCIEDLIWHQEQPFGSPSIYMQWEVMRLARERGVTVLLDGQGGDELFCGYEGYIPMFLADLLRRVRGPVACLFQARRHVRRRDRRLDGRQAAARARLLRDQAAIHLSFFRRDGVRVGEHAFEPGKDIRAPCATNSSSRA